MRCTVAALAAAIATPAVGAFHLKSFAFTTRRSSSTSRRPATIFYPGGSQASDDFFDDELPPTSRQHSRLMEELTRHEMSALARLAVAFCPEGQSLGLKNIEHVEVLDLDESHLDIQAVVCTTDDGCVTLKVPVTYPNPCYGDDTEGCILDNFYELDHEAEERIREIEWCEKRAEEAQLCWKQLTQHDQVEFPSWWTPPLGLTEECDMLRNLLNEDEFQQDLVALAMHSLLQANKPPLPPAPKPIVAAPQPTTMEVSIPVGAQQLSPIEAFLKSAADAFRRLTQAIMDWLANDAFSWLPDDVSNRQVEERERVLPKEEVTTQEPVTADLQEIVPSNIEDTQPKPHVPAENQELADGVEQAAVAAICPAGMYMRAKTALDGKTKILEIPVAFEQEAKDVDELRDVLMATIDSVATPVDAAPASAP